MRAIARRVGHLRWLRVGVRDRFARRVLDPDRAQPERFEVDFFGYRYPGTLSSYIDWNVYFFGAYEAGYLPLLRDLALERSQSVFLDIGANVGHHTLYMARWCDQIHSFEPNAAVRHELHRKLQLNSLTNVYVHDFGLGAKSERLRFFLPSGANQGTGSFVEGYSDNNREQTEVDVRIGDEWVSQAKLSRIDLIKIDVEGFERQVLAGLSESLRQFRPRVALEWSGATRDSFTDVAELLSMFPPDYRVQHVIYDQPRALLFSRPRYQLTQFDFATAGDILLTPVERLQGKQN